MSKQAAVTRRALHDGSKRNPPRTIVSSPPSPNAAARAASYQLPDFSRCQ